MGLTNQVQILDKAVCISHHSNTFGKSLNLTILLPAIGKIIEQAGFLSLDMSTSLGEGKL